MVVVSHLFLFYGKISGADVTWYESHLPLFGTIYFPIAPFVFYIYTFCNLAYVANIFFVPGPSKSTVTS